jgi:cytochrome bd-type quinol oxidase subunit 2
VSARHFQNPMFDLLIILVMVGIVVSLGFGLYFLVKDRGKTERTVRSLTVRVGLAVLLLVILAIGFMSRHPA